jgi:GTP cyclohydrolase I
MTTRGIRKHGVSTITSHMTGDFRTDPEMRREFLAMVKG